ncbi:heme peroxidase family protein [Leptolyngbya sp. FACHB-261]|uniref:peroxidase family protein n=1 Tax=Leptolyngbya sp. FACHB-261 TaxID=2692806 RepID=UPI001684C520|nr:heme peroxidase family protein [Leptolyngbya sp. FACHB-261]MBD2104768.1 peroxidase [Leptolyngbya sp. FACHB-261]
MKRLHGFSPRRGDNYPLGQYVPTGKFGRLFPNLRPLTPSKESLTDLGNAMLDTKADNPNGDRDGDNPSVPAGYTYLGQFIDHDITLDTTALKEVLVDPLAIQNFRTPALDLDSVYGSGPSGQPFLYDLDDPDQFLIGSTTAVAADGRPSKEAIAAKPNDLPRVSSGLAVLGDPRNDENLIVAQLHLAFLKFHNKVVQGIKNGSIKQSSPVRKTPFEEARDIVIWHYQWIVLHDFLRLILDIQQLDLVLKQGRAFYKPIGEAFIPVEFSAAAYRLGHSMIRSVYDYNRVFTTDQKSPGFITPATLDLLFAFTAKSGTKDDLFEIPVPSNWIIDWRLFFDLDAPVKVNPSRKLDPFLVNPLANLPNVPAPSSLAVRNLLRGSSLGLPPGQSIARSMGLKPLKPAQIAEGPDGAVAKQHNFHIETPLWYYILKEAQIQAGGRHLGQLGSRIIAEVFVGLLETDSSSFLSRCPDWKPTLPAKVPGTFTFADLLRFVDDLNPIGDKPAPSA